MARMHSFTQQWQQQLSPGITKRHYDWDGLFMNDPEIGLPPGKSWEYLPSGGSSLSRPWPGSSASSWTPGAQGQRSMA
jgi:hypothetical protein